MLPAVFLGGVVGALARVTLGEALPHHAGTWPWATFLVNVAGAFVLGLVVARRARAGGAPTTADALLGPGFCGALTTFSSLQLELFDLLDAGHVGLAIAYAGGSVTAGLAAVLLAERAVLAR